MVDNGLAARLGLYGAAGFNPAAPKDAGGNTLLVQNGYKPNGSTFESKYGKGDRRPGQQGRCYLYNGTNNYSTLDAGFTASGDFTLSFNINATSFASAFHVFSTSTTNDRIYFNSGSAFVIVANGTLSNFTLDKTLVAGTWYNILIRRVSGTITVYVDGVAQSDTEANAQDLDFLYFSRNGALPLPAKLFDVRYFNSAITDAQITYVVSQGRIGDAVTPTNWWKCDEQAGTRGYDSIGGNHLTHSSITESTFHATQDICSFQNNVGYTQRMYFDGANDYVNFGSVGNLGVNCRVQFDFITTDSGQILFAQRDANRSCVLYQLASSNTISFYNSNSNIAIWVGTPNGIDIRDGKKHTLLFEKTGNDLSITIDGYTVSVTKAFADSGNTGDFAVGGHPNEVSEFKGVISNVKVDVGNTGTWDLESNGYGNTDADWVDTTGNGNNGTVVGSPSNILFPRDESNTTQDVLGNTLQYTGKRPNDGALINSNCVTLNGTNQGIRVADNTDLDITDNLTVMCWAKNDNATLAAVEGINGKWDSGTNEREWAMFVNTDEKLDIRIGSSDGSAATTQIADTAIDPSAWHHYAFTFTAGTVKLYIDGNLVASTASASHPTTINNETADLMIGSVLSSDATVNEWDGQLCDMRVYAGTSTVLTADEILSIYQNPTSNINFDGQTLKAHYKLAEGAGTQCLDASGNANHGTIENAGSNWTTLQDAYHANINTGFSKRMYFDGVNDYVNIGNSSTLNIGVSDFVLQASFLTNSSGVYQRIIDKRDLSSGYTLGISDSNVVLVEINDGSGNTGYVGNTVVTDGNIHLVRVEANRDGNLLIFLDGNLDATHDISSKNGNANSSSDVWIGVDAPSGGSLYFEGLIYDLLININGSDVALINGYGNTNADWTDQVGSNDGTVNGSPSAIYIPSDDATPANDVFGSTLTNPAVNGHNDAESISEDTFLPIWRKGRIDVQDFGSLWKGFTRNKKVSTVTRNGLEIEYIELDSNDVRAFAYKGGIAYWKPIKQISRHKYKGDLCLLNQKHGVVKTTPNHSVYDIDFNLVDAETDPEILGCRMLNHRSYKETRTEGWAKICAAYVSDGWSGIIKNKKPCYGVHIVKPNREWIEELASEFAEMGYTPSITSYKRPGKTSKGNEFLELFTVNVYDEELYHQIRKECGNDCKTKKLPGWIFNEKQSTQKLFLKHLLKGDGCTYEHSKGQSFSFCSTSQAVATGLGVLLSLLKHDYVVYYHPERESYDLSWGGARCLGSKESRFQKVSYDGYVYDIEVEDLHNFVCGVGNVVVHNTAINFNPDSVPINANIVTTNDGNGSSYVEIADNAAFDITDNLTVMCWAKNDASALPATEYIITKYDFGATQREWAMLIPTTEKLQVNLGDPADGTLEGIWISDNVVPNTDQWHHYAFTFSGGTVQLYVDGVAVSGSVFSGSIPSTLYNGTANVSIFTELNSGAGANYWNGSIQHCRIYSGTSTVLTAAQVLQCKEQSEKLLTFSGQTLVCAPELMSDTLDWSGNNLHGENNGITFTKYTVPTAYSFGDTLTATYNHFKREKSAVQEDRFLLYRESLEHNSKLSQVENYTA